MEEVWLFKQGTADKMRVLTLYSKIHLFVRFWMTFSPQAVDKKTAQPRISKAKMTSTWRQISTCSIRGGIKPARVIFGYRVPISWNGRDRCQHLKQQPVYLAISCSVARWEWECSGREWKHQGRTRRRSGVETTNFPQEDSDARKHERMNTKCIHTYRHMHTDMHSATNTHSHTHTHQHLSVLGNSRGSLGLEAVAAECWPACCVLTLWCISCLMSRCQPQQLIYHKTITHWLTLTFIGN